ncbi:MAG: hypothetical protein ABIQ95_16080 [Bdellovibrionia bacterium]
MCKINRKAYLRFGISIFLVAISYPSSISQAAQTSYRQYYKSDKKAVNATLDEVLSMMESEKGGQSALHMGGIKLQELISIHNQYALGDPEKLARLNSLKAEVQALKTAYLQLNKSVLTPDQITAITCEWAPDQVGQAVKLLIENQFLAHRNYVHVSGIKAGVGVIWGGEIGFGLGRLQTTFGKNYAIGGFQESHGFVAGPSVSFTQHFGNLRGNTINGLAKECLSLNFYPIVRAIGDDNENMRIREITLCPFKWGEKSGMKTGRLFPIPGRNYQRVREQLGITYAATMRIHQE